jgi:iron(III) transport system ATP-binding protein
MFTNGSNIALRCQGLTKRYGDVVAVEGVDITLIAGETLGLVGPSGCGKTTLLRLLAGLEVPNGGTIEAGGKILAGPGVMLPPEQRRVGIVFQDFALFPHLTVVENIVFGLKGESVDRAMRTQHLLDLVGIADFRDRMPDQLSGGEQQRVALARALAAEPEVLLMDEPFSNLDPDLRIRVRHEIKEVLERAGVAVAFVTHDQEEALFMADRIAVMRRGKIEQVDSPERIFHHPSSIFVGSFLGTADFLPAWIENGTLVTEIGPADAPVPVGPGIDMPPDGDPIQIMIRPDDLILRADNPGHGIVIERTFTGPSFLYSVRLDSGTECRVLAPYTTEPLDLDARVALEFSAGHPFTSFVAGRTVEAQ